MRKVFDVLTDLDPISAVEADMNKSCLGLTRRTFLKGFGATLAALSIPAQASSALTRNCRSRVAVVRRDDIEEMTRYAILLAGGLYEIKNGETVFIKPNLAASGDRPDGRGTTHPEVLRAVIRAAKERTAPENITVGDRAMFTSDTMMVAEKCGIHQVCAEEGINVLPLESDGYINFIHPSFEYFKRPIAIPEVLSTFNHFINVPMCKYSTICCTGDSGRSGLGFWPLPEEENLPADAAAVYARITPCMKNFVDLMRLDLKYQESDCSVTSGLRESNIGEKIAELNLCVPNITMNVIDAISALVVGRSAGPEAVYAQPNMVIASKDRVACDSVGLAVLKYHAAQSGIFPKIGSFIGESVWESPQIARAGALGLGNASASNIKIISRGVQEIDAIETFWA